MIFKKIQDYQIIGPEDCKDNKYCIQSALSKSKHVKLKAGIYNIVTPISIKNKVLVGDINGKTLIDAKLINTKESIILKSGIISNIQLENAFDNGIYFQTIQVVHFCTELKLEILEQITKIVVQVRE